MDDDRPWRGSHTPCGADDVACFHAAITIHLGNGRKTSFWHDRWLFGQSPASMAPDLLPVCTRKNISVQRAFSHQTWMSGLHRISNTTQLRQFTLLWHLLQQTELRHDIEDSISWNCSDSGTYSARSAYLVQFHGSYSTCNFSKLWKAKVELKCGFFMLLWICGHTLTNDNLAVRGLDHNQYCNVCNQTEETPLHLIFKCTFAQEVWLPYSCLQCRHCSLCFFLVE
nr:uncharacterized protein LOC109734088 [Aegilops tauschii subsp. strangulata]